MRLAQLDRAFGYGPKGRGFESSNARMKPLELFRRLLFCVSETGEKIVLTLTFGQSRIKKQKRKIFVKLFV